jgi:hypothetical protein
VFIRPEEANPDTTMRIGVRNGNLYRILGQPAQAFLHTSGILCNLWHRRMGHLHHIALPLLRRWSLGSQNSVWTSRGCVKATHLARMSRKPFVGETRSKGILDKIHSDIGGPMSVASVKGASYYVTFIDDFSKKTWIYFIKTKDEVFSHF